LFFVICQLIWVAISIIRVPLADSLYYASSIILWQYTLERILHQKPVDMEPLVIEPAAGGGRFYAFEDTLPKMMEQEGLYLNPQLSIKDLATHVGTNRTYLSDYFVNVLQTTFYDYINSLRIEKKSIPLMQEHPDYTIERIATESGFNSISTFHRSFQKLKGMSPGTYKKKMNAIRHS
jgi:AraC-like DNA-binding protein